MELTFLSGAIPLTKTITYSVRDDHYTTTPYPLIQKVTSHVQTAKTIHDFARSLEEQGAKGRCLLKGSLDQPLVKQSRAGHSIEAPHDWIVFDFDKVDCAPTFDGALQAIGKYLPRTLADTDCVIQLSASCARPDATHLSAHVFVLLDQPVETQVLTDWFTSLNFVQPLEAELALTDSAMALRFPLDRTVSSPAKLIYIAPPRCIGFEPRSKDMVRVYQGKKRRYTIPSFAPISHDALSAKINTLRTAANLTERSFKTRNHAGREFLLDAEACVIHDIKASGDGYIRFNMNGGDSLAYFVNLREPGVIGNFKGEPYLVTQQAAPALYKALTKAGKSLPATLPPANIEPLAFYATNRQSMVYIGTYNRETDQLRVDPSNVGAAVSWMGSFGIPIPQAFPHYDIVYDMHSPIRFEDGYPIINLYEQTEYLKQFADLERSTACEAASLDVLKSKCPVLWRVMFSALGSSIEASLYFINWLATVFQRRTRTMSAWVLCGVQGTGKGMIVNHILRPLFGEAAVTQQLYSQVNTNFNQYLEGKLFVVIDEAELSTSADWASLRSKIYDWITEPFVSINAKGQAERDVPNHTNILLLTNGTRPVQIEQGDRRFNVGERQEERLLPTPNEVAALVDQRELKDLAEMLGSWIVNDAMLIQPYGGEAKAIIYESTHSLLDRIARAIHQGETTFFVDNRPDATQLRSDFAGRVLPVKEYDELLQAMAGRTLNVLTPTDLYVLFRMVAIHEKTFPETKAAQKQIFQRYGLGSAEGTPWSKRLGKSVRGFVMAKEWDTSHELRELTKVKSDDNVLPISGRRK